MPVGQFSLHMLNQSNAINSLLGRRSLRLQLTSSGCGSARPRWCRRRAPRPHATQKRYLALRKHGSTTRHSISPSRAARRQARAFAPHGAVCSSLFLFFEDRTAPRQRGLSRKVVSGKGLKQKSELLSKCPFFFCMFFFLFEPRWKENVSRKMSKTLLRMGTDISKSLSNSC